MRRVGNKVDLRTFPVADLVFASDAAKAVAALVAQGGDAPPSASAVVGVLNSVYPNVRASERDDLSELGLVNRTLYLFRDGRVRREDVQRERLYNSLATARSSIAVSRAAIDHGNAITTTTTRRWSRTKSAANPPHGSESDPQRPRA